MRLGKFKYQNLPKAYAAAVAAGCLLVIGIGVFLSRPEADVGESLSGASVSEEPTGWVLPLAKAPSNLTLDSLSWQGNSDIESSRYLAELTQSLEPYVRDDFHDAIGRLTALQERYQLAVEPFFYLGVSHLFLGQYLKARASLQHARLLGESALTADIEWYLAVVLEREGRPQDAAALLEDLCTKEGPYRGPACRLYPHLK
jgi:hypothetical protein